MYKNILFIIFCLTYFLESYNLLKSSYLKFNHLFLNFTSSIENRVTFFKLKGKNSTRYVFDIKYASLKKGFNLNRYNNYDKIHSFRIAQFNYKTLRVVITSKYKIYFKKKDKSLILILPKNNISQIKKEPIKSKKKKCYKVLIDPGHGGKDPGAIGLFSKEKDITFAISKKLYSLFKKDKKYCAYMTRYKDTFIELKNRTDIANKKQVDIFISIHANAIENKNINGLEVYYLDEAQSERAHHAAELENSVVLSGRSSFVKNEYLSLINREKLLESYKLGLDIRMNILRNSEINNISIVDNGIRSGNFWVLVGAQMPSILIELGYLTNRKEAKKLLSSKYQNILANGIKDGVLSYLNTKNKNI